MYDRPMSCLFIYCCMVPGLITAVELTSGESNPLSFNTGDVPYAGLYVIRLTMSDADFTAHSTVD